MRAQTPPWPEPWPRAWPVLVLAWARAEPTSWPLDWVRAPLFPRYLFVTMDMALDRWRAIASTIGVTHLVCQGERPAAVPEGVVEELQARAGDDGMIAAEPRIPFKKGEPLQVLSGALADRIGFFDCATDEQRVGPGAAQHV